MTTTTETFSVDGVVLNTLATNFATFDGRLNGPSIRGSDLATGHGPDRGRPRWYGPKRETWSMWVDGGGSRAQANANLSALKAAFLGNPGVALSLEKKVLFPSGLVTMTATGNVVEGESFKVTTRPGGAHHEVSIDLVIPGGMWLGASHTQTISGTTTVTVEGDARVPATTIVVTGATTIANSTTATGFAYSGTTTATITPASGNVSPSTNARHYAPASDWALELAPGANTITGAATITWTEGYL